MLGDSDSFWDSLMSSWWGRFVGALIMFSFAGLLYLYLTDVEEVRGRGRVHWIIAIVYNLVGKWGTVLMFVIPGLVFTGMGIHGLREKLRGDEDD